MYVEKPGVIDRPRAAATNSIQVQSALLDTAEAGGTSTSIAYYRACDPVRSQNRAGRENCSSMQALLPWPGLVGTLNKFCSLFAAMVFLRTRNGQVDVTRDQANYCEVPNFHGRTVAHHKSVNRSLYNPSTDNICAMHGQNRVCGPCSPSG